MTDILAQGKNSRLYKRLVYTDQIATSVGAEIGPFEIGSQMQITATVKPGGDAKQVEKALDEELARFLATGPTREELDRIKTTDYAALRTRRRAHRRRRRQGLDPGRERVIWRLARLL